MFNFLKIHAIVSCILLNAESESPCRKIVVNYSPQLRLSIEKWQSDSTGCNRVRSIALFYSIFDSIKLKNISTIKEYLGKPNLELDTSSAKESYKILCYYFYDRPCSNQRMEDIGTIRIVLNKIDETFNRVIIYDY